MPGTDHIPALMPVELLDYTITDIHTLLEGYLYYTYEL
jgi:hypothetical protein